MLTELRMNIDDSIFLSLKQEKETFTRDMLFAYALQLYRKQKLSLGKAAQLAGYTRLDFLQKLQAMQEPIFDYEPAMVDELIASASITPSIEKERR